MVSAGQAKTMVARVVTEDLPLPNTRVQRTSLRSPLTRKALGNGFRKDG